MKDDLDEFGLTDENAPVLAHLSPNLAARIAARPRLSQPTPGTRRGWQMPMSIIGGKAGETKTTTFMPRCVFHGQKLIAMDTAGNTGTRIVQMRVGNTVVESSGPTAGYAQTVSFKIMPAVVFEMTVEFLKDCDFHAAVFGEAIL